jgi:hypothetical protein
MCSYLSSYCDLKIEEGHAISDALANIAKGRGRGFASSSRHFLEDRDNIRRNSTRMLNCRQMARRLIRATKAHGNPKWDRRPCVRSEEEPTPWASRRPEANLGFRCADVHTCFRARKRFVSHIRFGPIHSALLHLRTFRAAFH